MDLLIAMAKKKKGAWWTITNSGGKSDVTLTLMIAAFVLSCFLALAGAVGDLSYGDTSISFQEFNMGFATVVFCPLAGLYFGRRWTDTQAGMYNIQALFADKEDDEEALPEQPE